MKMKNRIFKTATLLAVSVLSLSAGAAIGGGGQTGNGGDASSAEFVHTEQLVLHFLEEKNVSLIDLNFLRLILQLTKVESTNQPLILDGIPKDALNFPSEHRILFNRERWAIMNLKERASLALHEDLGLMDINDRTYQLSQSLLAAYDPQEAGGSPGDSLRLGCSDGFLNVSLVEHRDPGPENDPGRRGIDLILIDGVNILVGERIENGPGATEDGPIELKTNPPTNSSFKGNLHLNFQSQVLTLKGLLKIRGQSRAIDSSLQCKEMRKLP